MVFLKVIFKEGGREKFNLVNKIKFISIFTVFALSEKTEAKEVCVSSSTQKNKNVWHTIRLL